MVRGQFMVSTMFIYFEPDDGDDVVDGGFVDAAADAGARANGDELVGRHRARSSASAASTGTTADMKAESSVPRRWPLAALRSVQVRRDPDMTRALPSLTCS